MQDLAVVVVALFDDAQATAAAPPVDEGLSAVSVAVREGHRFGDPPSGSVHEGPPFGSVGRGLPFGLAHVDHPFESEHEGPPSRMVWCPEPLAAAAAAACPDLHC